ncbi:hypothetical protein ACFFX0_32020 [Citricoccus parietis]|uniref:Uncharacterized protein n=1 Tax=Citricoccus parietis TaxID=592307 RepID=A0ABV5G9D2_9MICC
MQGRVPQVDASEQHPYQEGGRPHHQRVRPREEDAAQDLSGWVQQGRLRDLERVRFPPRCQPDQRAEDQGCAGQGGQQPAGCLQQWQTGDKKEPIQGQDHTRLMASQLQGQAADQQQRRPPQEGTPRHGRTAGSAHGPGHDGCPDPGQEHEQQGGPPQGEVVQRAQDAVGAPGAHVDGDHPDDCHRPGDVQTDQSSTLPSAVGLSVAGASHAGSVGVTPRLTGSAVGRTRGPPFTVGLVEGKGDSAHGCHSAPVRESAMATSASRRLSLAPVI